MAKKNKEKIPENTLTMISKESFSREVDQFIADTNSDVMSSIIYVAEKKKIELESVSKFLNPNLKGRLEAEAMNLRLVKPKNRLTF